VCCCQTHAAEREKRKRLLGSGVLGGGDLGVHHPAPRKGKEGNDRPGGRSEGRLRSCADLRCVARKAYAPRGPSEQEEEAPLSTRRWRWKKGKAGESLGTTRRGSRRLVKRRKKTAGPGEDKRTFRPGKNGWLKLEITKKDRPSLLPEERGPLLLRLRKRGVGGRRRGGTCCLSVLRRSRCT